MQSLQASPSSTGEGGDKAAGLTVNTRLVSQNIRGLPRTELRSGGTPIPSSSWTTLVEQVLYPGITPQVTVTLDARGVTL